MCHEALWEVLGTWSLLSVSNCQICYWGTDRPAGVSHYHTVSVCAGRMGKSPALCGPQRGDSPRLRVRGGFMEEACCEQGRQRTLRQKDCQGGRRLCGLLIRKCGHMSFLCPWHPFLLHLFCLSFWSLLFSHSALRVLVWAHDSLLDSERPACPWLQGLFGRGHMAQGEPITVNVCQS